MDSTGTFKSPDSGFEFNNRFLEYCKLEYGRDTEREVEVPVTVNWLKENIRKGDSILEIGNVLSYYQREREIVKPPFENYRIIDLAEKFPFVENMDIMDVFSREMKFDVIISISTVEHIGQIGYGFNADYAGRRNVPIKAIQNIYTMLTAQGRALITVPFGVYADPGWFIHFDMKYLMGIFDDFIEMLNCTRFHFIKRIEKNTWIQVNTSIEEQTCHVSYGSIGKGASCICAIEIRKDS